MSPELPANPVPEGHNPKPLGDTNRESLEETARRATKAAADETVRNGGTGAARGADAKSQPRK
jgi:hypothetical protein